MSIQETKEPFLGLPTNSDSSLPQGTKIQLGSLKEIERQRSLKRQKADIQKDLSRRRLLKKISQFLLQPLLRLFRLRTRPSLRAIERELEETTSQVKAKEEELAEHTQQNLTAIQPYQEEKTAAEEALQGSFGDWLMAEHERVIIYTLSHPRKAKKTINKFQEATLRNPPWTEVYDYLLFGLKSGFTFSKRVNRHLFNQ